MCNKAHLYLHLNDYQEFAIAFQEISDLRNLYKLWHDKTLPLQCHLMGTAYKKNRNFPEAKKMFSMAVNAHQELPSDQRNDLNLVVYLCDLAFCFIAETDLKSAEKSAIWAVNILYRLKLGANKYLSGVIEIFVCIAEKKGDTELSKRLRKNLQNLTV